jgi:hypothetical protein
MNEATKSHERVRTTLTMSNGWPTNTWAIPPTVPAVKSLAVLLLFDMLSCSACGRVPLSFRGNVYVGILIEAVAKFGEVKPCFPKLGRGQERRDSTLLSKKRSRRLFVFVASFEYNTHAVKRTEKGTRLHWYKATQLDIREKQGYGMVWLE